MSTDAVSAHHPLPFGLYTRLAGLERLGGSTLPASEIPAWEVVQQSFQPGGEYGGVTLVERVLAAGLTLRAAWEAMAAYAFPLEKNT